MMPANPHNHDIEQNLLIIGAGGHGSEVRAYIEALTATQRRLRLLGFIDDNRTRGTWRGTEVLGRLSDLEEFARTRETSIFGYITAFGDNGLRHKIVRTIESFRLRNLHAWTLVHPTSLIGPKVEIGHGTLLAPNTVVTTGVHIGDHTILNVRASVSHDCAVGDFVNLNPAAVICGRVEIGEGSYIGAGAVVKDRVRIGRGVTVGAGAVVIHDLPDGVTAVGVPARVIKESSIDWLKA